MINSLLLSHLVLILSYALAIGGIVHMLRHRRSPGSTIAWLMVFVSLPFLGTALYLMFGGRKMRLHRRHAAPGFDEQYAVDIAQAGEFDRVLRGYGAPPATSRNAVTLCRNGVEGYRNVTELIDQAEHRIYLVTFILSHDSVGSEIRDRFVMRAKQGLDVRVLVDGLGSVKTSRRFFGPLVEAGGQFAVFRPVIHLPFRTRTNLRNHRKMCVADGKQAFAGGMNITEEDVYPTATEHAWQDVSLGITGPAAAHLESIFLEDWRFTRGTDRNDARIPGSFDESHSEIVQVIASGPDTPGDPMYSSSLTAIFRAKRRVWIATPYFVPNDTLVESLVFACQRGVDVRILIPSRSNHPLTDLAGASLLRDIQRAGGQVLRYGKGMVHAKAAIIDDDFAAVGSANFDMRSLFLNYEVMQVCYSPGTIDSVSAWFLELAEGCDVDVSEPSFVRELFEGAIRTVSPLF